MENKHSTLKAGLLIVLAVAVLAFLVGYRPADVSRGGQREVIQVWHPWGGPMLEAYQLGVDAFEKSHPAIGCKLLYVPNDMSNSQKFYTAVIGNCAPEVTFVDGPQVAEWAHRGLLAPLDDLLREQGIDPAQFAGEFFPPCWRQSVYRGKIYGITYCADPNFCFFWNKKAIRDAITAGEIPAGAIDVDKPPATLEELDRYNELVTRQRDSGAGKQLDRLGLIPWGVYGYANSLFTWGWAFGGEFYDEDRQKVTANDPRIVQALEWMCKYAQQYGFEQVTTLQSTFGSAQQNPFIVGKQVMQLMHLSGIADLDQYAPRLEYGMAPIPGLKGADGSAAWVGGWTLSIPAGVTDPAKRRAALEFILWSCASQEGTSKKIRTARNFPGWKKSQFFDEAQKDSRLAVFADILKNCRHQRPVMPAQAFYMDQINRAVEKVVRTSSDPNPAKRISAKAALDEATRVTQQRLDKLLAEKGMLAGQKEGQP